MAGSPRRCQAPEKRTQRIQENASVHLRRVKATLPAYGQVGCLTITDKQFSEIELFVAKKEVAPNAPGQQLELF